MNKKNDSIYTAIRIEGGLLSTSLLDTLRHYGLPGQGSADYGIEKGLKLADELGRYWRIAQARWEQFTDLRARNDIDRNKLAVDDWLSPLLTRVLDFEIEKSTRPASIGERTFPITHTACNGVVPLVLTADDQPLDKGDPRYGQEGRKRSPMGLAQEYLNAEDHCLWAVVSNGLTLRLLRDNPAMTRPAYVEVDLERIFNEELYVDFTVFWLLLHATRLVPQGQTGHKTPENCYLELWREQGQTDGERVLGQLRYGVTDALRLLGTGFVSHPGNKDLRAAIQSGELSTDRFFQELLRLIYRYLFLLTTEDRDILLDPEATHATQNLYREGYSISNLRDRARLRRYWDRHDDAWQQLLITFAGFATGQSRLGQPALGGLFAQDQCPMLEQAQLANHYLFNALFKLCYFEADRILVRINYRDMDTEELGSVYESLLELIPQLKVEGQWRFGFMGDEDGEGSSSGHARKLTGSYYTPDSLVQELIQSALVPVIKQRLEENPTNPREALLAIRVCDPACGSGHFLLAAARRLAAELARIEVGADQPSEADYRHALRQVVRHCIYGVDVNPLAVELCRTALWLEAIEPGKPLGFLDAHVQVGNSLVGIYDPTVLSEGITDDAFKPTAGDCKEVSAALKNRNKINTDQADMFTMHIAQLDACAGELSCMPEENIQQVKEKREAWLELMHGAVCQSERLRADLYMAAYLSQKTKASAESIPTNIELAEIERGELLTQSIRNHVDRLARTHSYLHWHLAYPEVFEQGGFDVIVGNPPWDVVKKEEHDKLTIEQHDKIKHWFSVGLFEKAKGKKDLYKLFILLGFNLIRPDGRLGLVIPVGVFIEDKPFPIRKELLSKGSIEQLSIYQNTKKAYFKSVDSRYLFGNLVVTKGAKGKIRYSTIVKPGKESVHSFVEGDAHQLLGSDLCIPLFNKRDYAELYFKILENIKRFKQLKYRVSAEFHASSDKSLIQSVREDETDWVLYKNDGIHQFDYQYGEALGYISNNDVEEKIDAKGFPNSLYKHRDVVRLVFRDIARADDSRTLIACLMPYGYVSTYDIPMLLPEDGVSNRAQMLFLLGYMNSLVFDFLVRPYVDKHVKGYILHRLPIPVYDTSNSHMKRISSVVGEMIDRSEKGYSDSRAIVDASVVHLAGLSKRDFLSLLSSFDVLARSKLFIEETDDYASLVMSKYDDISENGEQVAQPSTTRMITRPAAVDLTTLPDDAWARPMQEPRAEMGAQLAAVLKAMSEALPARQVRLAVLLAFEPRLLLPYLNDEEAATWRRLIGDEANPLSQGASAFIARTDQAWGAAVRNLRTNGHLVEDTQAGTWAQGTGLDRFVTKGWPDARAKMVIDVLQRHATDAVMAALPADLRDWVDAAAA